MAELPEIEVLRRDLERELVGKKVKAVEVRSMSALGRYNNRKSFVAQLDGAKFTSVDRRGLYLLVGVDPGHTLVIALGASGQLRRVTGREKVPETAEITVTFTQGGGLALIDPDGTATAFVTAADELADALPELAQLGFDPIEEPMSWTRFGELVVRRATKMKTLLTDPTVVVGIGELYADEILFHAGLRHDRMSTTLSSQELRRLYRALVETLHDAVKYRGTTLGEDGWRDLMGKPGEFAEHLAVYGRDGQLSPRSRAPIQKVKFEGRWTYFCETQV
jgi:formamidopyrimidine-DNA glycosylase